MSSSVAVSETTTTPRPTRAQWWTTALTDAEHTGGAPPAWAEFTETALSTAQRTDPHSAPTALLADDVPARSGLVVGAGVDRAAGVVDESVPCPQATEPDPCAPFGRLLAPFADAAVERLRAETAHLPGVDLPRVLADTAADLRRRLGAMAARTFVYELHSARGTLTGDTGAERFADYLRRVDLRALLTRYPVLARIVGQTCLSTVSATVELLTRLAADRPAVARLLGQDPGPLVTVRAGMGDRHRGGRAAALLEFADGSGVAYQPRPLESHAHFGDLVAWLDGHVRLGLRPAACAVRDGYGWVELVRHAPCRSAAEVDLFYRRQGALLALLYALDATDIHYDNLIAAGGQPVLIDVETLFHPVFPEQAATGPDPAEAALAASVARTALLPVMVFGDGGALDISALGAADGTYYPTEVTRWVDAGTDTMRLERRRVPFTASANRPVLDGRPADPADHLPALLSGFRAAYSAIADHSAELAGQFARCADAEVRVVVRHTQRYADLLTDATHPELLRRAADRDRLFALLRADPPPGLPELPDHEIAELWAGDVPTFHTRPASRHIWTADGTCLPHRVPRTGLRTATAKLTRCGPVDQRTQEWVIEAAFATRGASVRHSFTGPFTPDRCPARTEDETFTPDRALAAAVALADDIAIRAVHARARANWLGVEAMDDRFWTLLPMGAGLTSGYTGVALFLAQTAKLADRPDLRDLAAHAVAPVGALVERFTADPGTARHAGSGVAGVAGIAYALARLGVLLADPHLLSHADALVPVIAAATDPDTLTVHDGVAGALLALLAIHATTASPESAALAAAMADRLAATAFDVATVAGVRSGFTAASPESAAFAAAVTERPVVGVRSSPESAAAVAERPGAQAFDAPTAAGARSGFTASPESAPFAAAVADRPDATATGARSGVPTAQSGLTQSPYALPPGFLYGAAGVAHALLRYAEATDSAPHRAAGVRLLDAAARHVPADPGWCAGWAGIALACAHDNRSLPLPPTSDASPDASLCHGELGVLTGLAAHAGVGSIARRGGHLLDALARLGPRGGAPSGVATPGLLAGTAGIGYGLLNLGFPDQVPSVLLFAPDRWSSPPHHPAKG